MKQKTYGQKNYCKKLKKKRTFDNNDCRHLSNSLWQQSMVSAKI